MRTSSSDYERSRTNIIDWYAQNTIGTKSWGRVRGGLPDELSEPIAVCFQDDPGILFGMVVSRDGNGWRLDDDVSVPSDLCQDFEIVYGSEVPR
jgi:hypothetical protein